jgi:hypothetical protein
VELAVSGRKGAASAQQGCPHRGRRRDRWLRGILYRMKFAAVHGMQEDRARGDRFGQLPALGSLRHLRCLRVDPSAISGGCPQEFELPEPVITFVGGQGQVPGRSRLGMMVNPEESKGKGDTPASSGATAGRSAIGTGRSEAS